MKVKIKDWSVTMDILNKGMELGIWGNGGQFMGDLRIGKATIEWCKGKKQSGNGVQKSWEELIRWFES